MREYLKSIAAVISLMILLSGCASERQRCGKLQPINAISGKTSAAAPARVPAGHP
jgi:outer membrane murein-binding lipoprotein Lpp